MQYVETELERKIARETIVKDIVVAMINNGFMDDYETDKTIEAVCKACDEVRKHIHLG